MTIVAARLRFLPPVCFPESLTARLCDGQPKYQRRVARATPFN